MAIDLYKVLTLEEWERASKTSFVVTDLDRKDGFIHFSTSSQLSLTLALFFSEHAQVVLLQIDETALKGSLIFEYSGSTGERSGSFPHLYGDLSISQVVKRWRIERGAFALPKDVLLQSEQ
ncbi:MAG: DUF952 domain-containing protein [Candidatus Azotimanducaceae bacterium]|nr:hypothetical protein [Gammaproteobacteria bacterium]